jgi:hypothetical protein
MAVIRLFVYSVILLSGLKSYTVFSSSIQLDLPKPESESSKLNFLLLKKYRKNHFPVILQNEVQYKFFFRKYREMFL